MKFISEQFVFKEAFSNMIPMVIFFLPAMTAIFDFR